MMRLNDVTVNSCKNRYMVSGSLCLNILSLNVESHVSLVIIGQRSRTEAVCCRRERGPQRQCGGWKASGGTESMFSRS